MTGDFIFGLACGVGLCVVLVILGSLVGRFLDVAGEGDEVRL
jgi:hypothetical protein